MSAIELAGFHVAKGLLHEGRDDEAGGWSSEVELYSSLWKAYVQYREGGKGINPAISDHSYLTKRKFF